MNIFVADEQDVPLSTGSLTHLAEVVLIEENLPPESEVAILFVDLEQIGEYNTRFMGREGPTDVLAFPLEQLEPGTAPVRRRGEPPLNLGDVVIAPSYVQDQAARLGVSFDDEMALMVTHGILHLLGYDHHEDAEAEQMEARERQLIAKARTPS